jgi:uncharacterized protein (TIGR02679 family)
MADRAKLDRTLGTPALARVVRLLARRLEFGTPLTGRLALSAASAEERTELGRLLGTRPTASIDLERLDRTLRAAGAATSLEEAVETLVGPVVPRAELRAAEQAAREHALAALERCVHVGEGWFGEWAAGLPVTRWVRSGNGELIAQVVAVLNLLPAASLPLSVLAERATGDTKALAPQEALSHQVLRAWALRAGQEPPRNQEGRRALWASAGVIVDDLASQVLVLNLPATGGMVASWLTDAAGAGLPFRLTLQQLTRFPVVPAFDSLHVCENPAVLRAAAERFVASAPLVCTEGVPSAACHELLTAVAAAGVPIHWRADFDWAGLRIVSAARLRYGAIPWRMTTESYVEALAVGGSEPLRGAPAESPWDPDLAAALAREGRAVMEERLLEGLLGDLLC